MQFTRSRPYRKNDNAHVEQKNYTHVRKLLGYLRYDKPELTPLVNDLLANDWCKFKNFFIPCQKTVKKVRVGSKIKRIMDGPKTPYRRLMDSDFIEQKTKRILAEEFKSLNPILLSQSIDRQMGAILNIIKMSDKPKERFASNKVQLQQDKNYKNKAYTQDLTNWKLYLQFVKIFARASFCIILK